MARLLLSKTQQPQGYDSVGFLFCVVITIFKKSWRFLWVRTRMANGRGILLWLPFLHLWQGRQKSHPAHSHLLKGRSSCVFKGLWRWSWVLGQPRGASAAFHSNLVSLILRSPPIPEPQRASWRVSLPWKHNTCSNQEVILVLCSASIFKLIIWKQAAVNFGHRLFD